MSAFCPQSAERAQSPTAFHAKVYYFERPGNATAIVGSANLSPGGLWNNSEAALCVRGPAEAAAFENIRSFLERTWNSPYQIGVLENPDFMEEYERAYTAARKREAGLAIPPEAPVYQTSDDVAKLRDAFAAGSQLLLDGIGAYILGLVSGGWHSGDLRRRAITIELRRGLLNPRNNRRGEVYFEGVSERGLDQRDCVRRDGERILTRLQRTFESLHSGDQAEIERRRDLSYRIHIRFAARSPIWQAVRPEIPTADSNRRYFWPEHIELEQETVRRSFLQGYMDIRTRISATDAQPQQPHPLMRVAVSVGRHAPVDFPQKLRNLMAKEFQCEPDKINLLAGAARDRESIIRIDASLVPTTFLESHWQRIVVADFREYNAKLSTERNE